MPQFAYRARDAQGSLVEGVLDCPDRAVAIRQIELQKCIPVRIELMGPEAKTAPRAGARRVRYNFYDLHGAAVVRIHGTNWRSAPIAHANSDANPSCNHGLLVGRLAVRDQRSDRFPRACSHR